MRTPLRAADIFHMCMTVFLFGVFSAAQEWNIAVFFPILAVTVIVAAISLRIHGAVPVIALVLFPCSVFYYHLRTSMTGFFSYHPGSSAGTPIAFPDPAFFPYRHAALLSAFIRGSIHGLPSDLRSAMEHSGTSYLAGMYGYKLHLIKETVTGAVARITSRRTGIVAGLCAVISFIVVAGSSVSAMRTGIMIVFVSFAEFFGRRADRAAAFFLAAFLMILFDPAMMTSAGFMLSFASLAGIYLLAPAIGGFTRRFRPPSVSRIAASGIGRLSGRILGFHATTAIAVNLAILPIIVSMDGSFPLISFVSNIFAALPFGAILELGVGSIAAGMITSSASLLFALPLNVLLGYEAAVIRATAAMPLTVSAAMFPPAVTAVYYLSLIIFTLRVRFVALRDDFQKT